MIKVSPSSLSEMYIEWDDLIGDTFTILRSHVSDSDFEILAEDITVPFFIDKTVNFFDDAIRYYYKVESYQGGVKISESEPTTNEYHKKDAVANKVVYESKVVLRVMDNPPVYVLIKKREGTRCPDCWNPITKKVRYAGCLTCNGTGILIGYYPPVPIRISTDVSYLVDSSSMLDGNEVSLTPVSAWVSNSPRLVPGDVIVDIMNQRYEVSQVVRRTRSQYLIRQILQLFPLRKGHPSYGVEVDRSVKVNE